MSKHPLKNISNMDHWTFQADRKSCVNCTNTGETLDYYGPEVKDVFHYCTILETNQFRNTRTSSRTMIVLLEQEIEQFLLSRSKLIFVDFTCSFYFIYFTSEPKRNFSFKYESIPKKKGHKGFKP